MATSWLYKFLTLAVTGFKYVSEVRKMDHQVTFQGRICCSAAGKVASKELPAVSSSGSALPAQSHLTWSYVLPWAACLQALSQPDNTFSRLMSGLNQLHFSLGPICFLPTSFYSKCHAPQTLSVSNSRSHNVQHMSFSLFSLLLHLPQISGKCLCIPIFWNYHDTERHTFQVLDFNERKEKKKKGI